MNDKLEDGNNNLTCLFTKVDWDDWYGKQDRVKKKAEIKIKVKEENLFVERVRLVRLWRFGCYLCTSRSRYAIGIKQHYKNIHGKHILCGDVRKHNRLDLYNQLSSVNHAN